MASFAIECPNCGGFAQASTGFFATQNIQCSCGHKINIKTDRFISRECSKCGNMVLVDQLKGEFAKCPICKESVNSIYDQTKKEDISCGQCGVTLAVEKGVKWYTCPVCDYNNNVAERSFSQKLQKDGLASVVKFEGDGNTLVWKHPIVDFNYGSQLIVHENQEAIFYQNGQALDLFGPGRYTLETQKLPMMDRIYKLATDNEGTFHSEVYFVNLSTVMGVKWGTDSKVRMFDPGSGLHLEIGACGEFNIRVVDSRKLLVKLVGTSRNLEQSQLVGSDGKGYFRAMIMSQVKSFLAKMIKDNSINILEIDERLMELSDALKDKLNHYLEEYGLSLSEFFVSRIITPDDDPNFIKLRSQYAEQYLRIREEQIKKSEAEAAQQRKMVEAQTEAQIKIMGAQGDAETIKLKAQADAEAYRMQAEVEAMEMRMKGFNYQQETSRQVGLAAMKNGIVGNGTGGTSALGDLAGLGIGLGAMGSMVNMTKNAMSPVMDSSMQMGQEIVAADSTWDCICGNKGIKGGFCGECGTKRPVCENVNNSWNCACGEIGITGKFCTNCGSKRPEQQKDFPLLWDCECGTKGNKGKFCAECGKQREE